MTENFKMSHLDYKVRIELLLLCRIILLRLSQENLVESLRKIWPNLLNELVSIFETNDASNEDGCALILEALKLIEILSLLNLEDFQLNQWIFLLDSYNMVKSSFSEKEMKKIRTPEAPQHFIPYIVGLMDTHSDFDFKEIKEEFFYGEENVNYSEENKLKEDAYRRSQGSKKYAVVEMSHVASDCTTPEVLTITQKAETMQVKAGTRCTEMTRLDWKNAEQVIEKDFIDSNPIKE